MRACFTPVLLGYQLLTIIIVVWPASMALAEVEEMTVTARRIEESMQTVPVSITALDRSTLENAGVRTLSETTQLVPNLTFEAGENGRRAAPTLRGIGLIDSRGFDNAVGVFIDGVYVGGRASQNVRLLDIERVEVIRGPQSALYGRNTFAGAINYVSSRPSEAFESSVEAIAAEDGRYELQASIKGPLFGNLSGGLSAAWTDDDGMFDNAGPVANEKNSIGGGDSTSVAGNLRYQPSDAVDIMFSAFYAEERLDSTPMYVVPNNCGELDPNKVFPDAPNNLPSYDRNLPAYRCSKISEARPNKFSLSPEAYSFDSETTRLALDMNFTLGDMALQSITAWTKNENNSKLDLDRTQTGEPYYGIYDSAAYVPPIVTFNPGTSTVGGVIPLNVYFGIPGQDQDYFSQELRLVSSQEEAFRWSTGLYYFDQTNMDATDLGIDAGPAMEALGLPLNEIIFMLASDLGNGSWLGLENPILPVEAFNDGSELATVILTKSTATQYSAFGSVEYDFTNRVTGTAELRYTYEERTLDNVFDIFFGSPSDNFEDDWSFWDPRFTLRFQATDDLMIYGSIAKGTRSGGQNGAIADPDFVSYDEESNWTYELGTKTEWLDRQLQVNVAAFYIDWSDAQFRERIPSGSGFLTITRNSTGITSYGFELEVLANPFEGFTVGGNVGYADSTFDNGTLSVGESRLCEMISDPDQTAFPLIPVDCVPTPGGKAAPDISGNRLLRTAKTTASGYAQLIYPAFGDAEWLARLDASYRSELTQDLVNIQSTPAMTLVKLRLGIQEPRYDVMLWAENLLDTDVANTAQIYPSNLNSFRFVSTAVGINQRRYGVTFRYRFGAGVR